MVAARSRRRFLSLWLTSLMLTGAFAAVVPTGSADQGQFGAITFQLFTPNGAANAGNPPNVRLNDTLQFRVHGNLTVDAEDCFIQFPSSPLATTPTIRIELDLRLIGRSASEPLTVTYTQDGSDPDNSAAGTYSFIGWLNTTVTDPASSGDRKNGVPSSFTATVRSHCQDEDGNPANAPANAIMATATSAAVDLDTMRPDVSPSLIFSEPGKGGIGKTIVVQFASPDDISGGTLHVSQVDDQTPAYALNPLPQERQIVIRDTGFDAPEIYVNLTDARGNHRNFTLRDPALDAASPPSPAVALAGNIAGGNLHVAPDNRTGDVVRHRLNLTLGGVSTILECPGADCPGQKLPQYVYNISAARLLSNTSYRVSLQSFDEQGNVGPWSELTAAATTAQVPQGTLVRDFVSGSGGIGSVVRFTWDPATVRDVASVRIEAMNLTAPHTLQNASSFTFTVEDTGKLGAGVWINLTAQNGHVRSATLTGAAHGIYYNDFDTVRPGAPGAPALKALAQGAVEIRFAPPADTDVTKYRVNATCIAATCAGSQPRSQEIATFTTDATSGEVTLQVPSTLFTGDLDRRWRLNVTAIDAKGNDGAPGPDGETIPSLAPLVVSPDDVSRPIVKSPLTVLPITGQWAAPNGLDKLNVSLRNETNLKWWTGRSSGDPWSTERTDATRFAVNLTGVAEGRGTFSADFWCDVAVPTTCPEDRKAILGSIPDGNYSVVFTIVDNNGVSLDGTMRFVLDRKVPVPTQAVGYVGRPDLGLQQGADKLRINASFGDDLSGMKNVTFQLIYASNESPAIGVDGNVVLATVRTPSSGSFLPAEIDVPLVALGDYRVTVTANDTAGNTAPRVTLPAFKLQPRLSLNPDPARPPFATADGLRYEAYAAFDSLAGAQPQGRCESNGACRVTKVEILGRNRTASEADAKVLDVVSIPLPGTLQVPAGTGPRYYNYSAVGPIGLLGLNRSDMYVRAVATLEVPGGGTVVNRTPWTRVATDEAPAGLAIQRPGNGTVVYMNGAPGTITLNATYEKVGLDAPPALRYNLKVLNDTATPSRKGMFVDVLKPAGQQMYATTPWDRALTVLRIGEALYYANFTNAQALPSGEYELSVSLLDDAGAAILTATRFFAVEATPASVAFAAQQPHVQRDHVPLEFDLHVRVAHGFANLSRDGLWLEIDAPKAGGGTQRLRNNSGGFSYATSFQPNDAASASDVVFRVKLPANASDGARFDLHAGVVTLSNETGGGAMARASVTRTIILDKVIPAAHVLRQQTNDTGKTATGKLAVHGVVEDYGSGVGRVEVRIVDLTNASTFVWNDGPSGAFRQGLVDSWLSSATRASADGENHTRGVELVTSGSCSFSRACWTIRDEDRPRLNADGTPNAAAGVFDRIGLDRNHTYQIEVRAYDLLGLGPGLASTNVTFDPDAPVITQVAPPPAERAATGYLNSSGHGNGNLTVRVKENWCVARVTLVGERPDGSPVTPVHFARPDGAECGGPNATADNAWRLDLAAHPEVTRLPGRYNFSFEAADTARRVARAGLLSLVVNDTEPAFVANVYAEPPIVRAGGQSRVVAEIHENGQMDEVRVVWLKLHPDTGIPEYVTEGLARLDPARPSGNGTYWYVAETDDDLNVTALAVGDYMWQVRAYDSQSAVTCNPPFAPAMTCHQRPIIVRVTDDAAPYVSQQAPAPGAAWVNATPEFRFSVDNYGGTATGIAVSAGTDPANLTAVNASEVTVTPVRTGGNVTGAIVAFRPTLSASVENYTIRVSATPADGLSNASTFGPFRVDAVAPEVTLNVTGLVTLDGQEWAVATTRVTAEAVDAVSNVTSLTYRVNGGAATAYGGAITPSGSGDWRLVVTALDGAGNAGTNQTTLRVDTQGPTVNVPRPADELLLTVEDAGSGVDADNVTVFFAYGGATTFTPIRATRGTGNTFTAALGGDADATGLKYYVVARDLLGNVGGFGSAADPKEIPKGGTDGGGGVDPLPTNRAPTVRIVQPSAGSEVPPGQVTIQWDATDADGDEVLVSIALRGGNDTAGTPVKSDAPAAGSDTISVTGLGPHTLIVIATDGTDTTREEVTFTVRAAKVVTRLTPLPPAPAAGEPVEIKVQVADAGRPIRSVSYVVQLDGERVETGPLARDGDAFAARFTPTQPGQYEILVVVAYMEGPSEPATSLGTFTVAGTVAPPAGGSAPVAFLTLVVLAVLTIGLAAAGAFGRWKK